MKNDNSMKLFEADKAEVAWEDEKGNLLVGDVLNTGERFFEVQVTAVGMKRKNYKPIPIGTKYLVPKHMVQFQNKKK